MLLSVQAQSSDMFPYYLFAFFVFILICLILLLWRFLFAGLKRKERMELERKEEELKTLLTTLRKEADDFFDLASDKSAEISDERKRVAALVAGFALPQTAEPVRRLAEPEFTEIKPAPFKEFQKAIDEAAKRHNAPKETEDITAPDTEPAEVKPSRREQIIALSDSGKDLAQIAKDLGITRNEVDLVLRTRI